ncbi:GFA family protein [bacterium]|nr:GFA family protein [bacterium]
MVYIQKGGCLCQSIRYEFFGEPVGMAHCHCSDCRKASGSAFATVVGIPLSGFTILQGEPKGFSIQAESGNVVTRCFCSQCGSQLYSKNPKAPDVIWIKAGSLDDSNWVKPALSIWTSSAQPWSVIPPETHNFPKNPTFTG